MDGSPGTDINFFEYPDAVNPGRPGAGMVHRIAHRVAGAERWTSNADRLGAEGVRVGPRRMDCFQLRTPRAWATSSS